MRVSLLFKKVREERALIRGGGEEGERERHLFEIIPFRVGACSGEGAFQSVGAH